MEIAPGVHAVPIGQPKLMHPGGTSVYLVGHRDLTLVDTYEERKRSPGRILRYLRTLGGARIVNIVMTHKHHDHIGGVVGIRQVTQARLLAHRGTADEIARAYGEAEVDVLADGAQITGDGPTIQALHTPGHSSDHTCYYLPEHRLLFSGDTILGIGTTTIENLAEYMQTLQRLRGLPIDTILPGHGPPMPDGQAKIEEYLAHRAMRERQALEQLSEGPKTLRTLVDQIYVGIPARLHWAARRNLGHHIEKLIGEGRVTSSQRRGQTYYQLSA